MRSNQRFQNSYLICMKFDKQFHQGFGPNQNKRGFEFH